MTNILLTGGTGFLGSALSSKLTAEGHQLISFRSNEVDLTQAGTLDRFNDTAFDAIYHLAAWTQAGDFCLRHPGEQWIINQQMNTNMLTWWQKRQPQAKLISIGTSCAYDPDLPLSEEYYLTGKPIDSLFTYAMTKRMLHSGLLALNKQFGLHFLTVVPSTLYGPGYHTDGRQMHFIFDLIRKILRGKIYNEPVVLWGDGNQKRELIHVDDFVTCLTRLADDVDDDLVNIGAGEEFTIRHFAELICEIVGYDPRRIEYDTSRYVGAKSKCLSIDKLNRLLPEFSPRPLEQGLRETVEWFLSEQEKLLPAR